MRKLFTLLFLCVICSCNDSKSQTPELAPAAKWDFDNMDGWRTYSQDDNPDIQISLEDGIMKIFTRKESLDRKKAATAKVYTTGRYAWKTYISPLGVGDWSSIGSWIYCDDHHEIDFEVGYGSVAERKKYDVTDPNLMLAYMTTQDNPYQSTAVPVSVGWHIFEIDLSLVDGKYLVKWIIDGKECAQVQQTFGSEFKFSIYCSVENLKFVGDHLATQDNYGLFDWVTFTPHE